MFNLKFADDDILFDISREELSSIFEWRGIVIDESDLNILSLDIPNDQIVKVFSKYCGIEENIGEYTNEW
ncbi:hypothetical protein HpCK38_15700 [Helicobacter pylori]